MAEKTISDHLDQFRTDYGKSIGQIPNVTALSWFNKRMHELEDEIANFVNNGIYDEYIAMDLVAGQKAYAFPTGNARANTVTLIPQLKKLLEISVKYDSQTTQYTKCTENAVDNMNAPLSWYETQQTTLKPFFIIKNRGLELYPVPTVNVTGGLHLRYERSDLDAVITNKETEISIPRTLIPYIYRGMALDLNMASENPNIAFYKQDWVDAKKEATAKVSDTYITATNFQNPNLRSLMY